VTEPVVVILAAGQGTRMRSHVPKGLHDLCGRPLVAWPVAAAREAGAGRVVVVDGPGRELEPGLPDGVELAVQPVPDGTGGAVRAATGHLGDGTVLVLNGDVPLVTAQALDRLLAAHRESGAAATVATMTLDDPSGYGRVVRGANGSVERIVETKHPGDATPEQQAIQEVNGGVYAFEAGALAGALERLSTDNAQGELYLTDVVALLAGDGRPVHAERLDDPTLLLGVNDRAELARVRAVAQRRIHEAHMRAGVTIVDPGSTVIEAGVRLAPDTVVEPSSYLRGSTSAGAGSRIGPLTTLIDATLGEDVHVPHSYVQGPVEVRDGVTIGPFAYLRPGTLLRDGSKAGTFVEIKNSDIGEGAKVPHLSYVGDAEVGARTNLGAATITANYDGRKKHRTTIGQGVRTGVDTTFVAPVTVGDGAYTAAGSVITKDVPPDALGVARARQSNIEGYARRPRPDD
jgi:bifunctional UDP-N-acetylglucosamine pyrophosphorylase/glucosamine-1-phosphate N-acetyltransferase